MKLFFAITLLILAACGSNKATYPELIKTDGKQISLVFKNINFFDGEKKSIQIGRDIFIKNGKIEKILSGDKNRTYEGYEVINGRGRYLMPGLIDAHVHIQNNGSPPWRPVKNNIEENLKANLYCGVTTIMDLGGFASKSHKINKSVMKGELIGPNIYNSHIPITVKNAHPIPAVKEVMPYPLNKIANKLIPTAKDSADAIKVIDKYAKQEIDFIKIIYDELPLGSAQMKYDILKSLIDQSHQQGYKAVVHIGSVSNAINAIRAGADILAHGVVRGKLTPKEASIIANSKVPMIYTLMGHRLMADMLEGKFIPGKRDSIVMPKEILNSVAGKNGKKIEDFEAISKFANTCLTESKDWIHNVELLIKHKATILVGTDAGVPGAYPGTITLAEFKALSDCGMDNITLLKNATYNTAKAFIENPKFGAIKEGYEADLLFLDKNPLKYIESVFTPKLIISNGIIIKRL
jgi:imidazolonepropionase-like amidohydrolase